MASPFDVFRKNQRAMFAILGVVCMITFVIAPALSSFMNRGYEGDAAASSSGSNPPVVTWSGGSIREKEMMQMQIAHGAAVTFLRQLLEKAIEKKATPRAFGLSQQSPGIPGEVSENIVVDTLIFAEKAKKMGVVVDDVAVTEFIANMGGYALAPDELKEIMKRATHNRMSEGELFEQLRLELLAQHARMVEDYSSRLARTVSISEAWDYHNRLNRRVGVEFYPLEVAAYESKVTGSPTEKEKQELFDKHKFDDPNPNLPTPGFHRPPKLAFAYFKLNFAPFLEAAKKEIPEDKVKAEYDTRVAKGDFKVPVLKEEPKKEDDKKPEEKPADDKKPADKPAEKTESATEENKTEPKKEGCQEEPAAEKKDDKEVKKDEAEKKEDSPAKPADPKAEDEKKEEPKRTQTYEEVKDKLHAELASPIANDALKKAQQAAMKAVNDYSRKFIAWQTNQKNKNSKSKIEDPGKFDFEAIGKQLGLESGSTPLINQYEAKDYEIGKNGVYYRFSEIRFIRDPADFVVPFPNFAFGQRLNEFNPQEIDSNIPDLKYLFWVTETKEAESPKLADKDVQEAILQAWKKSKAFELAKQEAADLAAKAKGKELKEVVPDPKAIIAPPPFSWMTTGAVAFGAGEPRLGQIQGIEGAGPELMEAVCTPAVGENVVAWNYSHSKVFVAQVIAQEPTDEVLRNRFLESGINNQLQQLGVVDTFIRNQRQAEAIYKEFAVVWHRPAGGRGAADE